MPSQLLAQGTVRNPFGFITGSAGYLSASTCGSALFIIIANLIKLAIVIASLYTLINFLLAGYSYLSAGADSKAISKATEKIWQSVLGLTVVAGSFVLAAIVGRLIFGNALILLQPRIYIPQGSCTTSSTVSDCTASGGYCFDPITGTCAGTISYSTTECASFGGACCR